MYFNDRFRHLILVKHKRGEIYHKTANKTDGITVDHLKVSKEEPDNLEETESEGEVDTEEEAPQLTKKQKLSEADDGTEGLIELPPFEQIKIPAKIINSEDVLSSWTPPGRKHSLKN